VTLFFSLLSSASSLFKRSFKGERQIPHMCVTTINEYHQQWFDVFDCFKALFTLSSIKYENMIVTLTIAHAVTFGHSRSKTQICEIVSKENISSIKIFNKCVRITLWSTFSS